MISACLWASAGDLRCVCSESDIERMWRHIAQTTVKTQMPEIGK